jgi:hypothetical protein
VKSRERIKNTINHIQPDKLPLDIGSSPLTGMHVSIVYRIRKCFGLEDIPVKVIDPFQMLGEIDDDLKKIIGVDVAGLWNRGTIFGFDNKNWKEWRLNDSTSVMVPGLFNTEASSDGSVYQFAEGDKNYPPSAVIPAGGYYFDSIIRQKNILDDELNPLDNLEEYKIISEEELDYLKNKASHLYNCTEYSVMGSTCYSGFGDIAFVPGPMLKDPKGIRDISEWYMSLISRKDYIKKVFGAQLEIAVENYRKIYEVLGEKIDVLLTTGTDFGSQQGLFISKDLYRDLFKPYHKKINDWIHANTDWKSFIHSCGGIYELIPDLINAGFDILNPVQISAIEMEPKRLKEEFGKDIVFWGGGIDTQRALPFGTPKEVKEEVKKLIDNFNHGGGFVFSAVHNIQPNVPVENVVALIETIQEFRS